MAHDPMDPSGLSDAKHHNKAVQRASTRRGAAAKTAGSLNRADDMNPSRPRRDPYELPLSAVQGYPPALQDMARLVGAMEKRRAAEKKRGRKP